MKEDGFCSHGDSECCFISDFNYKDECVSLLAQSEKTHILPFIWKTRIDLAQFLILLWQSCQAHYNFAYYVAFVDNNPS